MKKLIKYFFLLLLVSILTGQKGHAQTPQLNEEKYWDYRDRLQNEFMIGIGPEMGMSIPASVRDSVDGILQWTDCTIALGEYIGVLALEYKILQSKALYTDETVEELFYALYALNRLDYTAEPFFGGTPSLNGFFIRDDIDEDSLNMGEVLTHLNQGLAVQKITGLDSDYMDENPLNNEESLDQAILLITGLSLVTKCVPADVVYVKDNEIQEFQDFETSLSLEAGHIINRIVNYMKEGDSVTVQLSPADPNLYGILGNAWDFIIKNPVSMEEVLRGGNAFFLSKGFTSAKYHASGQLSPTINITADTLTNSIFLLFEEYIVPNDQDFKVINLNAMANYWPDGLQEDTTNTGYNAKILGPRSKIQDYEWIPMLHQIMFDGINNYLMSEVPPDTAFYNDPKGYYEYLLNLAPPEGPYNYEDSIYPNWEWSSTSRTIQPARRGEVTTDFKGNYNGLDYMLYYNMHTLILSSLNTVIEETSLQCKLYPNPCTDYVYVETHAGGKKLDYECINMGGIVLSAGSQVFNASTPLFTGHLPNGLYILKLTDGNHTIIKKIVKHNK
ncbi:MAG: T9SS type A sorting domain-containing protein [Bacteroidota bacterium]